MDELELKRRKKLYNKYVDLMLLLCDEDEDSLRCYTYSEILRVLKNKLEKECLNLI